MARGVPLVEPWWVYAVAGVATILFGLAALLWPGLTLIALVLIFGIYALVDGVVRLIAAFRAMSAHTTWWPHLLIGLIGIAAGLFVLFNPVASGIVLLYVIAFWAIATGLLEILAALTLGQLLLLVVGALSIVFGLILLGNPVAGALGLVFVIGIFAIVRGIILLVNAFRAPTLPAAP